VTIQYKHGTGLIQKLTIESTVSPLVMHVKDIVLEMSYYESIETPAKSVTLAVADGTDFKYSLPLLGGERVSYSFSDSISGSGADINVGLISGDMRVYKLANDIRLKRELNTYDLFLTTDEMLTDSQKSCNLAIKSMNVSDIVKKLYNDHVEKVGKKPLHVVETEGLQSFTFNGGSPFSAINQLASEAKSKSQNSSSLFVFYENNKGYHFTTVEELFKAKPKYMYYYIEDVVVGDDTNEQFRLISMSHDASFDLLNGTLRGQFGTRSSYIDLVAKSYGQTDYTLNNFSKTEHLGGKFQTVSDSTVKYIGSQPVREKYVVTDGLRTTSPYIIERDPEAQNIFRRRPEFSAVEQATISQLRSNVLRLAAYGNSRLQAGDVIDVNVPATGKRASVSEITNKSVSGKYLIVALCHRIRADGTYVTTMECARDSFDEPLGVGEF